MNENDHDFDIQIKDYYYEKFCEIIESVNDTITERFESSNLKSITAIYQLITAKERPNFEISNNLMHYLKYIDEIRLLNELELWYSFKKNLAFDFGSFKPNEKPDKLRELFLNHNVDKIFPNITEFYRIYLTIPISNANTERSFSCLRRLKSYLRNTMGEQRLSDLALVTIE